MTGIASRLRACPQWARPLLRLAAGVLLAAFLFWGWLSLAECPDPLAGKSFSTVVFDRDGGLIRVALTDDDKYRIRMPLSEVPPEALQAVVAYEYFNRGNDKEQDVDSRSIRRNAQIVSLGGSYDFGVAKVFGLAQYADGVNRFGFFGESDLRNAFGIEKTTLEKTTLMNYDGFKGWAAHPGASIPVCGGLLRTGLYYADGKAEKVKVNDADKAGSDLRFYGVNAQYNYPLSKRTEVYTGLGYGSSKLDASDDSRKYKSEETTVYAGISHRF